MLITMSNELTSAGYIYNLIDSLCRTSCFNKRQTNETNMYQAKIMDTAVSIPRRGNDNLIPSLFRSR